MQTHQAIKRAAETGSNFSWISFDITRDEAQEMLMDPKYPPGSFIIRARSDESISHTVALTVKFVFDLFIMIYFLYYLHYLLSSHWRCCLHRSISSLCTFSTSIEAQFAFIIIKKQCNDNFYFQGTKAKESVRVHCLSLSRETRAWQVPYWRRSALFWHANSVDWALCRWALSSLEDALLMRCGRDHFTFPYSLCYDVWLMQEYDPISSCFLTYLHILR